MIKLLRALWFIVLSTSVAFALNPVLGIRDGGSGAETAAAARANFGAAASGVNNDITALLATLDNTLKVSIPAASSLRGLDFVMGGYPSGQPGIFYANKIVATVNQPLSGDSIPGSPTSRAFESFRVQTLIGTGYAGVELRSIEAIAAITGPLTITAGDEDIVALGAAAASSYDMGNKTLYAQSNGTICAIGCFTKSMIGYENDNNDDASLAVSATRYNPADSGYGGVPTLTFTLPVPLPPYVIAHPTQYFVVQTATTSWPLATFAAPSYITKGWKGLFASPDGLTLVINGPIIPSNQTFGTISGVTVGHIPQRFGVNLIAGGCCNAGKEAAVRITGGWWNGIMFDKSSPGGPTDTNGGLLTGFNSFSTGYFASFPNDIFTKVLDFDGTTLTGVDWAKAILVSGFTGGQIGPVIQESDLTVGAAIIYGHSKPAPLDNPLPANLRLPFVAGVSYPTDPNPATPIWIGADFEAPGVGNCPATIAGKCQITYQGATPYDVPWYGSGGSVPNAYCNGGTLLYATALGGVAMQLTSDGTGVAGASNILNLPANSQSETVNLDMMIYEQAGNRSEGWTNWGMLLIRRPDGAKTFYVGTVSSPMDFGSLGVVPSATVDTTFSGITLTMTPPASSTTWTGVACARIAHAQ